MCNKMSEGYFCELCGYITQSKQSYKRHLARKTSCNTVKTYFSKINENDTPINENNTLINENDTLINENNTLGTKINKDIEPGGNDKICNLCGKEFKSINSCRSHKSQKICQKEKKNPCECRRCLKIFPNAHARRSHMSRNVCNSALVVLPPKETPAPVQQSAQITGDHNTVNNINIVVNSYGNEKIGYISEDEVALVKAIREGPEGLQNIIKQIYFNEEHPENRTVQIPNVAKEICQTWDAESKEWKYKPLDKVSYDMMYKAAFPLHAYYASQNKRDRNFEKISRAIKSSDNRPEEKRTNSTPEDRKVYRKLVKDTRCTIMNNRDIEF